MKMWPEFVQSVIHFPRPGFPYLRTAPDVSGPSSSPAAASANDTEPEQSYPLSRQAPCPPPHRYGVFAISFAAWITVATAGGALNGTAACPSGVTSARWPSAGGIVARYLRNSLRSLRS